LILQEQQNIESEQKKKLEIDLQIANENQRQLQIQKQREEEERLLEAKVQKERENKEIAQRAEELRRLRAEEMQRTIDSERDFVNSIVKGEQGIKIQLEKLRTTCSKDSNPSAYKTAINSLQSLFSQILSHPEEMKYRKIRRDHPKFMLDIGRHEGGVELLIASGFRFEVLDDVPCLFSKEPDIEHDMERWSLWFDLLKRTLELIEEQMLL